ncbi:MAG: phosphoribosylanthranilate isomerase [Pirellulaceae bacterium]
MFHIKICGVTTPKDAQFVALAGADAVGLNFYAKSPRFIDLPTAEAIVKSMPARLARVGVFVNSPAELVTEYADRLNLQWLQLHGDEPPEFLAALSGRDVLRSFPFTGSVQPIIDYLNTCRHLNALPRAILIDASHSGEYGGTGTEVDWQQLSEVRSDLGDLPLVLAGGLTPFNVAEAISAVRPDAVDAASSVESRPGSKDLLLVRAFVTAAKRAFAELGR